MSSSDQNHNSNNITELPKASDSTSTHNTKADFKLFSHNGKEIPAHRLKYPHRVKPKLPNQTGLLQNSGHRPTIEDTQITHNTH